MKKFTKLFATLGAVAMLGLGVFTSCGSDDDDDPVLESIAVKENPTKTQYTVGDEESAFDPAGLVITEKWTEGKKDVDVAYGDDNKDAFTFSGFDASEATESQEITVTYKSKQTSFSVRVVNSGDGTTGDGTQKTLSSIAVKTEPTKKDYVLNTGFSADGLVITLTYSDGDTEDVTYSAENAADFSFDFDSSTEGTKEVTVTYKSRSVAEKITVTVTDKKVIKLEKSAGATAVEVKYGTEASAITGLSLVVTYDQGDPETITSGYAITNYDKNNVSEQTVTVTYGTKAASDGASNSTTYPVKVVDYATGIVATLAEGKTYTAGDATAKTDVVVTYKMASGATGETVAAEKYTVTPETVKLSDTALTVTSTEDFATKTAAVDITGKVVRAVFTKFDAADLHALNEKANPSKPDNIVSDIEAEDGSWKLTGATDKKYAQAKADAHETYDYAAGEDGTVTAGKKWTHRLSYYTKGFTSGLSLYVGANAEVTLRVDGGSVKAVKDNAGVAGKTNLTFKGAGDAVTWEPYIGGVTTYVTVTGNSDGYVVISTTDSSVGANIYGITKVTSKPTENLPEDTVFKKDDGTDATIGTAAVYNNPIIAGAAASYTQGETITASISNAAELVTPSKTQKVYADGHLGEATDGEESVDASSIKWTATGTAEGNTEANEIGTGASLSFATSATQTENENEKTYVPADTYRVVASYTVGEKTYSSEAVSVQIKDASKTYVTVKFDKNGGTLADGVTDSPTQEIESGAKTALTAFADLGITPPSGKEFAGWNTVASPTDQNAGTAYDDEAEVTLTTNTTLYAVYKAASVYTILPSDISSVSSPTSGYSEKITSSSGIDFYISQGTSYVAASDDTPAYFKLNGYLQTSKNGIRFTLTKASTVTVKFFGFSSKAGAYIGAKTVIYKNDGTTIKSLGDATPAEKPTNDAQLVVSGSESTIKTTVLELEAGEYALGSIPKSTSIAITSISITK